MSLLETFLHDPAPFDVWICSREDHTRGTGTAADPWNAGLLGGAANNVTLETDAQEAVATTADPHGLEDGDIVEVSDAQSSPNSWNGLFSVYDTGTDDHEFKYLLRRPVLPSTTTAVVRKVTCLFDEVMREMPERVKIHAGSGVFYTCGFAAGDSRGWSPKTGQVIAGMGMDVTTLRFVGARNGTSNAQLPTSIG